MGQIWSLRFQRVLMLIQRIEPKQPNWDTSAITLDLEILVGTQTWSMADAISLCS